VYIACLAKCMKRSSSSGRVLVLSCKEEEYSGPSSCSLAGDMLVNQKHPRTRVQGWRVGMRLKTFKALIWGWASAC
jgi:hypothetical protein